jgi:hypothetical protein
VFSITFIALWAEANPRSSEYCSAREIIYVAKAGDFKTTNNICRRQAVQNTQSTLLFSNSGLSHQGPQKGFGKASWDSACTFAFKPKMLSPFLIFFGSCYSIKAIYCWSVLSAEMAGLNQQILTVLKLWALFIQMSGCLGDGTEEEDTVH